MQLVQQESPVGRRPAGVEESKPRCKQPARGASLDDKGPHSGICRAGQRKQPCKALGRILGAVRRSNAESSRKLGRFYGTCTGALITAEPRPRDGGRPAHMHHAGEQIERVRRRFDAHVQARGMPTTGEPCNLGAASEQQDRRHPTRLVYIYEGHAAAPRVVMRGCMHACKSV